MPDLLARPPREPNPLITIKLRRSTAIAIGVSLLVHLLALLITLNNHPLNEGGGTRAPVVAHLRARGAPAAAPATAEAQPEAAPAPPPSQPVPLRPRERQRPPYIASRKPSPRSVPSAPPLPPLPPLPPQTPPDNNPQTDMGSRVAARQQERHAYEEIGRQIEGGSELTDDQKTDQRIAQNLAKKTGISGVFMVQFPLGQREAQFVFRGWTNSERDSVRQTYTVDAGLSGDVEMAVIRKMIEIIRQHYKGDFNWETRGGVVKVLSARPQDNAQLERYLHSEFFGGQR